MKTYTVIGVYRDDDYQRFAAAYEADSPGQAEEKAFAEYSPDDPDGLIIAGVIEGDVQPVA